MKKYLILFYIVSSALSAIAQSVPQKIDTLLTAFEKQEAFTGSVLVARGGTVLFEKGYGYKNKKENTWNDSNTVFQIGSITKQFTSAIILQLEEKNRLSLQDKLSKYIPDYPNGDQITIEHLLTHTSGVYNYTNDTAFMRRSAFTPISRDSLIATFKNKPLDFHPGAQFNYSNSGYILLGYIIEKVTGKSYFQVVRENIFRPLHMDHTGFDFSGLVSADKAIGYRPSETGEPAPIVDSSVSFAAGAIYTTLGDLYKWDRALYTGNIISPASLQKAFTPHLAKYGYGWTIDSVHGKRVVEHGGGIPGFVSYIWRVPEDQTCIVVLDNHPSPAGPEQIAREINALLDGKEYRIPHPRTAIHLDTTLLRQYVGEYQLAQGFILTISLENGSLMSQATGQGKAELFAEKENFFFQKVVDVQLEFIKGPDNKVEKLIIHQNGRPVTANKIK
jgi:CubicO group peptidase (beta-lactamase class C family)